MGLTDTKFFLVKDKKSDYIIVVQEQAHQYEIEASLELKDYFYQATGISLNIVCEGMLNQTDNKQLLVLGNTKLMQDVGISAERNFLGEDGFIIKRDGQNVFLCGGSYTGTKYAVYEFLHLQFGFNVYALDEIVIENNVTEKKLLDFDFFDKPSIPHRLAFGTKYYFSANSAHKMRFNVIDDIFIRDSFQPWHNSFRYFPIEEYKSNHPKWYIEGDSQLHFTAHGDAAEKELLINELFEKMKGHINKSFSEGNFLEFISFTHQDNDSWANDDSVKEYNEKYGKSAAAAQLIHFLNPLAVKIREFMDTQHHGYKMNIITFAYLATEEAPVKLESGKYKAIDDSVIMEDNLSVLYAPIYANYYESLDHPSNASFKSTFEKWKVITKSISCWIYSTFFSNYFMFYNSFDSMIENFKIIKRYNAYFSFNESYWNYGTTGFNALKEYLGAKFQWNVNACKEELIDGFFDNYFKNASKNMFKLFNEVKNYNKKIIAEKDYNYHIFSKVDTKEFWPLEVIDSFLDYINRAYSDILPVRKDNITLYNILKDRICSESLMFRYLKFKLYKETFGRELRFEVEAFKDDCTRLAITKFGSTLDNNNEMKKILEY